MKYNVREHTILIVSALESNLTRSQLEAKRLICTHKKARWASHMIGSAKKGPSAIRLKNTSINVPHVT